MDRHQGGIEVEDPVAAPYPGNPSPHRSADRCNRLFHRSEHLRAEFANAAVQGRIRADIREQHPLSSNVLDIRAAFPATGEEEQQVDHDLAAVVDRLPVLAAHDGV